MSKAARKTTGKTPGRATAKLSPFMRLIEHHKAASARLVAADREAGRFIEAPRAIRLKAARAAVREGKAFDAVFCAHPATAAEFEVWAKCVMARASALGWLPSVVDFQLMIARIGDAMDRIAANNAP